ncbi:putative beta-glucosidase D [Colletotrichum orbiculare MAFF 240422]|uniref:beta-glucosidase n=1 Tax=Colletotrichum orbiculare (strain 104-T / ATCC 96160 / CBS 514.97 / LARS 414 / MAFF 240422) TaxID=1213857 RepID=N4VYU5_COLOR|nr:putative beta-glucosidase D [Colletotrichum orbiculare MAFF 240422]
MYRPSTAWALAMLTFVTGALAEDALANYTEQLLGSGTIKLGAWQDAYDKAAALVATLTTEEKISVAAGGDGGNFTALNNLDSATNPLTYFYVTTWPAGLAMAMTWDTAAAQGQGKGVGEEFKGKGINMAYGPTLEPLGRSAWCGRTGETYGVDSYHAGIMAGSVVKGMSSAGIVASAKHFIMNEQETNRMATGGGMGGGGGGGVPPGGGNMTLSTRQSSTNTTTNDTTSSDTSGPYTVSIGDKAFHETYLWPFYDTVHNGMGGAMCAMNKVNGTFSCENQDLLAKYLKVELGFPGIVHADVSAQQTAINAANAGMDLSSSQYWSNDTLGAAVSNGSLTMDRLDDMAIRNMMGFFHLGQDEGYPSKAGVTDRVDNRGNHSALARRYAAESIALLKNTNNALPLTNISSIGIFGFHAGPRYVGANTALGVYDGEPPTMQGHMAVVGGSAMGSLSYLSTPFQSFNERASRDGMMLRWWLNDTSETSFSGMSGSGTELTESTVGVADLSEACVVYLNAWGGEGADRAELTNADQDQLVLTVAGVCNNTIVVVNTVGPRLVDAWIEHDNVTGVLYGGALGQESGNAIDDVLFGAVNPSGRLVHTIAKNESDYNPDTVISSTDLDLDYADGNLIDYKYFDHYNITPRYEFGYGLSYTTFNYSSTVEVDAAMITSGFATGDRSVGGREDLWDTVATVTTSIANTGAVAGAEVAQLYISFPDVAGEPARQLRGFQKVFLHPGESADVSFALRRRDLSVWDVVGQEWKIEAGEYGLYVGASSRDVKAQATFTVA